MTTVEAAGLLARHLKTGDFSKLSMSEVADVLEAMNYGLQRVYTLLPERLRRSKISVALAAPADVSVQATLASKALGNSPFATADVGKSVVVDGDTNWNEVAAVNALFDVYMGTTGTHDGVVYSDCVLDTEFPFERLVGYPILADSRRMLTPFNAREAGLSARIGEPQYYWLEQNDVALGGSPKFTMRLYPAPDQAYVLRMELAFWARRLALSALQTPSSLYIPDEFYESGFLPIARAHLTGSPAWADPTTKRDALIAADEARMHLINQPGQSGVPCNTVGTPANF